MNRFLLLLILFVFCKINVAQTSWCPQGATWYYSSVYGPPFLNAKVKVSYTKDSLFNSINCKYLTSEFTVQQPVGLLYTAHYFTYENNGVVYLNNANGSFDTLFNFNASIGDKWFRYIDSPGSVGDTNSCNFYRSKVTVLDTGSVLINTHSLKKLVLKYDAIYSSPPDTFHSYIIDTVYEKMGSIIHGWKPKICEPYYPMMDGGDYDTFRCYEDNTFGLYHKSGTPDCDSLYGVGINEIKLSNKFKIFPNPASDVISVDPKSNLTFPLTIEILNSVGTNIKIMHFQKLSDLQIKIGDLSEGLYFLKITSAESTFVKSFLKN